MMIQRTFRQVLSGAALVSLLISSVAATEVHLPNPRHTWGYGDGKAAYGTDETDDVLLMFECRGGGRIESTFLGLGSNPATQGKNETRASVIIRQHDGAELKVLGASQENLLSGAFDVAFIHDVTHPVLEFFKQDGIVELEGGNQPNRSTKHLISLRGARQTIEQLQNGCSTSPASAEQIAFKEEKATSGDDDFIYLYNLLKRKPYRQAWNAMMKGAKRDRSWIPDPNHLAESRILLTQVNGVEYRVAPFCKSGDCGANRFWVLFAPGGEKAWGLRLTDEKDERWFGAPGQQERRILQAAAKFEMDQLHP